MPECSRWNRPDKDAWKLGSKSRLSGSDIGFFYRILDLQLSKSPATAETSLTVVRRAYYQELKGTFSRGVHIVEEIISPEESSENF